MNTHIPLKCFLYYCTYCNASRLCNWTTIRKNGIRYSAEVKLKQRRTHKLTTNKSILIQKKRKKKQKRNAQKVRVRESISNTENIVIRIHRIPEFNKAKNKSKQWNSKNDSLELGSLGGMNHNFRGNRMCISIGSFKMKMKMKEIIQVNQASTLLHDQGKV